MSLDLTAVSYTQFTGLTSKRPPLLHSHFSVGGKEESVDIYIYTYIYILFWRQEMVTSDKVLRATSNGLIEMF